MTAKGKKVFGTRDLRDAEEEQEEWRARLLRAQNRGILHKV
jgi:hypothetical protein